MQLFTKHKYSAEPSHKVERKNVVHLLQCCGLSMEALDKNPYFPCFITKLDIFTLTVISAECIRA